MYSVVWIQPIVLNFLVMDYAEMNSDEAESDHTILNYCYVFYSIPNT